jgi:hypothetical protein
MVAADPGCRRDVELRKLVMPLRATRTIGTGDRCDITDGGIYPPDWAELRDMRPRGRSLATRADSRFGSICSPARDGSRAVSSRRAGT